MSSNSDLKNLKKREKVQIHFWKQVGSVEHISLPKLEDAIRKEFGVDDQRFVQTQIRLMETESRVKIQSNVKVWIKQPAEP